MKFFASTPKMTIYKTLRAIDAYSHWQKKCLEGYVRLVGKSIGKNEYTDSFLRSNLDQVNMLIFSLVVFKIEADRFFNFVGASFFNKIMNKGLIGLSFKHSDIINKANNFLEFVSSIIDAVF